MSYRSGASFKSSSSVRTPAMPLPTITRLSFFIMGGAFRKSSKGKRTVRVENRAMSFEVDIGYSSQRGPRDVNEDFAGAVNAPPGEESRGLIAAIADGVSTGGRGL